MILVFITQGISMMNNHVKLRMEEWMADYDDPTKLKEKETFVESYLLDEAYEIMTEVHYECYRKGRKSNETEG